MRGAFILSYLSLFSGVGYTQGVFSGQSRETAYFPADGSLLVLSQNEVFFHADGPPGAYDAEVPVEVYVGEVSSLSLRVLTTWEDAP